MSIVLKCINAQIKRDGMTEDNIKVLKLYNLLIENGLNSGNLFRELTIVKFKKYNLSSNVSHMEYYVNEDLLSVYKELLK